MSFTHWQLPHLYELGGSAYISIKSDIGFDLSYLRYELNDSLEGIATDSIEVTVAQTERTQLIDCFTNTAGLTLVSDRLKEMLEPSLTEVEFRPATIELSDEKTRQADNTIYGGGDVVNGYWWMHCWRRLDLIDYGRSDLRTWGESAQTGFSKEKVPIFNWQRLSLYLPDKSESVFGLAKLYGYRRFLSEEFVSKCMSAGLKINPRNRLLKNPLTVKASTYHG